MEIRTNVGNFSDAFKRFIVEEIETGRISVSEANSRYNILGHSTITRWRRQYGYLQVKMATQRKVNLMADQDFASIRMQNEIKALRQELEAAKMKNIVMETFVDLAEKELGIPIRKKYGAMPLGQ